MGPSCYIEYRGILNRTIKGFYCILHQSCMSLDLFFFFNVYMWVVCVLWSFVLVLHASFVTVLHIYFWIFSIYHAGFDWITKVSGHSVALVSPGLMPFSSTEDSRLHEPLPWLMMTWLLMSPGHHQPQHWLSLLRIFHTCKRLKKAWY